MSVHRDCMARAYAFLGGRLLPGAVRPEASGAENEAVLHDHDFDARLALSEEHATQGDPARTARGIMLGLSAAAVLWAALAAFLILR